jgi:hypothetical protein
MTTTQLQTRIKDATEEMERLEKFEAELKALLAKYQAKIVYSELRICGRTYEFSN